MEDDRTDRPDADSPGERATDAKSPTDQSTLTALPDTGDPQRVGPYRILQKIGEGGMGIVYEAEQEKPVRRRVALKLIKWGMDTKQVVARFEAERQALAMMSHPNIARVYDAGATEQGRPYFVMEYVKGVPITQYCDRHRLSTRERVKLFVHVCEGVQHAHQKGIIHRDIKPSNVLVSDDDGEPVPKLIDFGVAKAVSQRLTEKTLFTQHGMLVGTPEYSSPEQAELTTEEIDTRTDIYSLGMLLYELLVGALPFDPLLFRKAGLSEILRIIRDEEPAKPSTRISTLGEASEEASRKRRTDLASLRKQLRGDLDWIVMKALEKGRTRRYQSAPELAADIARYLSNEPVLASPPSAVYRMRKFAARHKVGVGFGVGLFALVLAFAVAMAVQSSRVVQQRDRANQEAETAKQVSDFMVGLFKVADPTEARGASVTAAELLDEAAEQLTRKLPDQPVVRARFLETVAESYAGLGLRERAAPLLEQALELKVEALGEDHLEVGNTMARLADARSWQHQHEAVEELIKRAMEIRMATAGPDSLEVADSLEQMSSLADTVEESEKLLRGALAIREKVLGRDHPDLAPTLMWLGSHLRNQHRLGEASPFLRRALEIAEEAHGPESPEVGDALNSLGNLYSQMGKYDDAEELHLRALGIKEAVYPPDHPTLLRTLNSLGYYYREMGQYPEAESFFLRELRERERRHGVDSVEILNPAANLSLVYQDLGRFDEAEVLGRRTLAVLEGGHYPLDSPIVGIGYFILARLYVKQGQFELAETFFEKSVILRSAGRPRNEILYSEACYQALAGQTEKALSSLRGAVDFGYADAVIAHEPDLASLHGDPEFEAIVAEVKKRIGEE